ncbi:MAG: ATP-dependent DNA helicase PIF1 [Alphaproteobacteria bacterium]|jgi:ATP-dependent DNA helicase PIF1
MISSENILLTSEFEDAFETLEHTQQNLFITGKAGTGKSTFLDHFRKNTKKSVVVVAPTGVSALNVRGQTIHSFFGLGARFVDVASIGRRRNKKTYEEIELVIIDEVSMVRADVLDGLEKVLRVNGPIKGTPFGGVQICVIGDLFQLPPVITGQEEEYFSRFYNSPFFFDAHSFDMDDFKLVRFNNIFRQEEDEFINILNRVRVGQKHAGILDYLNQRYGVDLDDYEKSVTLCSTNKIADGINKKRIADIEETPFTFKAAVKGDFDKAKGRLPCPERLVLKENAQVMFVKNDPEKRWVNGTIGRIVNLSLKNVEVEIMKGGVPRRYQVKKEKWPSIHYSFDEEEDKLKEEEVGSFSQYPLILAWAITIHKSQGKTLDSAIIDLGYGAFAAGQLYVALSRCRHFDRIALKTRINARDIKCDERILTFVKNYAAQQKSNLTG